MADVAELKALQEEIRIPAEAIRCLRKKLDTGADFNAEDDEQWSRCNADFDRIWKRMEVVKRDIEVQARMAEPAGDPRLARGQTVLPPAPEGKPKVPASSSRQFDRGLRAWVDRNYNVPRNGDWEKDAQRCGIRLDDDKVDVRLLAQPREMVRLMERRADLDTGTATEGAEFVPEGFVYQLEQSMLAIGGLRDVATILRTNTGNALPYPTNDDTGNAAVLVGEAGDASATADPTTGSVTFNAYKYSSKFVKVSSELITDSAFPIVNLLGQMLGERLARGINTACTTGDGSSKPNGIVTAVLAAGSVVTAADVDAFTADEVMDLEHTVDPSYRSSAYRCGFMMHDTILKEVRKLKDGYSQYLWRPGLELGRPSTLLNWPYTINQAMSSAMTTGQEVMMFGAMSKYVIREVAGIRLHRLVELYRETDQEGFIAFMRIDGDLLDAGTNPIAVMSLG